MARNKSPQTFEKRQRERRKKMKRDEKFERRLDRKAEKRRAKAEGEPLEDEVIEIDETGLPIQNHSRDGFAY
jgi:hypothetical protein